MVEVRMKRMLLPAFLTIPIVLAMSQTALAKPPIVKLTIQGGSLTKPIEITDPEILHLTYSRDRVQQPPAGRHGYEVSFYFKWASSDIRKLFAVYYYPNPSPTQGYVYIPGQGEAWTVRDLSSVITAGRWGKWCLVSPAWEQVIKPLIVTAEAADQRRE
jgi:hypothetical protein